MQELFIHSCCLTLLHLIILFLIWRINIVNKKIHAIKQTLNNRVSCVLLTRVCIFVVLSGRRYTLTYVSRGTFRGWFTSLLVRSFASRTLTIKSAPSLKYRMSTLHFFSICGKSYKVLNYNLGIHLGTYTCFVIWMKLILLENTNLLYTFINWMRKQSQPYSTISNRDDKSIA